MTSCKEAIKDIEIDGKVAAEMEEVRLCPISNMKPLIVKMDNALSTLKKCRQLRMSSNAIAKIEGLAGCDSLVILSLARNNLKKIEGLNEISDSLEQLWLSYNQIGSFAGIEKLTNLQVLYASNNKIDKWPEVERLQGLPKLRELNLVNNPLYQKHDAEGNWRIEVIKRLEKLKNLDGTLIDDEERERAKAD
jgi:dynein light chain 1, axonemal